MKTFYILAGRIKIKSGYIAVQDLTDSPQKHGLLQLRRDFLQLQISTGIGSVAVNSKT